MSEAASAAVASVRCAIYTRKSTEEGLEKEFNSLDAQREAAEAFIGSQRQEGWLALPYKYDDGGFSRYSVMSITSVVDPRRRGPARGYVRLLRFDSASVLI